MRPVSPNRPLLFVMVAMLAVGAGGGLAFLFSQLNPVIHDVKSLRDIAGIPVLGAISIVTDKDVRFAGRSDVRALFANVAALGVIFVSILAMEILGPGVREIVVQIL
jgi:hypothetical protein